jgi:hypothetical protein
MNPDEASTLLNSSRFPKMNDMSAVYHDGFHTNSFLFTDDQSYYKRCKILGQSTDTYVK